MRLFTETGHGLEPLWLWLAESGTPMAYESWEKVFDAANARVAAVFAAATPEGRPDRDCLFAPYDAPFVCLVHAGGAASRAGPPVRADPGGAQAGPDRSRPIGRAFDSRAPWGGKLLSEHGVASSARSRRRVPQRTFRPVRCCLSAAPRFHSHRPHEACSVGLARRLGIRAPWHQ